MTYTVLTPSSPALSDIQIISHTFIFHQNAISVMCYGFMALSFNISRIAHGLWPSSIMVFGIQSYIWKPSILVHGGSWVSVCSLQEILALHWFLMESEVFLEWTDHDCGANGDGQSTKMDMRSVLLTLELAAILDIMLLSSFRSRCSG